MSWATCTLRAMGVAEQVLAEPAALVFPVDGEARQQDHRCRVVDVAAELAGAISVRHRPVESAW